MNELLQKNIIKQKKLICSFKNSGDKGLLIPIVQLSRELSLVSSDFSCEKCSNQEGLQYHHLIQRKNKPFLDFSKYAGQRHYYENIIVLCKACHHKVHKDYYTGEESKCMLTILVKTINDLKKKYGKE